MSFSRVLMDRPDAGITTYYHKHNDGNFTIETRQHDCSPILELNKASASEIGKRTHGKDMVKVASIPIVVQYQWLERYGITSVYDEEYWPLIKRLLNSNEFKYLRTSEIIL